MRGREGGKRREKDRHSWSSDTSTCERGEAFNGQRFACMHVDNGWRFACLSSLSLSDSDAFPVTSDMSATEFVHLVSVGRQGRTRRDGKEGEGREGELHWGGKVALGGGTKMCLVRL
jgi:hypothetical protein